MSAGDAYEQTSSSPHDASPSAPSADAKSPQAPSLWGKVLAHPYWAGVAGLATVAALVLGIWTIWPDGDSQPSSTSIINNGTIADCAAQGLGNQINCDRAVSPSPTSPSLAEDNSMTTSPPVRSLGSCSVIGDNNQITCTIQEAFGQSRIGIGARMDGNWLFVGDSSTLTEPPAYDNPFFHCPEWSAWLLDQPGMYSLLPGADILMAAGTGENVTINRIEVDVYSREQLDPGRSTEVWCSFGAGGDIGFVAHVDTATRETTVDALSASPPLVSAPMPPATVFARDNQKLAGIVTINSHRNFLYEGRITITASVNGEPRTVALGSEASPYRWVITDDMLTLPGLAWDSRNRRWTNEFSPFDPPDA